MAERAVAVDDGGPNPYLPTPIHVLLQLPDERVQLARELLRRNSAAGPAQGAPTGVETGSFNQTDAYAPEQFADGLLFSTELRALFEGISRGGGATHTLTMGDLALAVHSWQLPFLVLLLAHSADAPALVARTDAWQRNVAHMAARAGNTRAVSLLPLREEALSAQDFMGRCGSASLPRCLAAPLSPLPARLSVPDADSGFYACALGAQNSTACSCDARLHGHSECCCHSSACPLLNCNSAAHNMAGRCHRSGCCFMH